MGECVTPPQNILQCPSVTCPSWHLPTRVASGAVCEATQRTAGSCWACGCCPRHRPEGKRRFQPPPAAPPSSQTGAGMGGLTALHGCLFFWVLEFGKVMVAWSYLMCALLRGCDRAWSSLRLC